MSNAVVGLFPHKERDAGSRELAVKWLSLTFFRTRRILTICDYELVSKLGSILVRSTRKLWFCNVLSPDMKEFFYSQLTLWPS